MGSAGQSFANWGPRPLKSPSPIGKLPPILGDLIADGLPDAAHAALGRLDIVINNAGVIARGTVVEMTDPDWTLSVGVNVEAPFRFRS